MKFKSLFLSLLIAASAAAVGIQLLSVRNVYTVTNVTSTAWVKIVNSTPYSANHVTAYDSSGQVVKLGTGVSSGSVATQIYISPNGTSYNNVSINMGETLWLEAANTTANTGEIDLNFSW